MKPGCYEFEAFNPAGDAPLRFSLSTKVIAEFNKLHSGRKSLDAAMIPEVLAKPTAIFMGLKRENMGDGISYCGVAKTRFLDKYTTVPFPPDRVFMVFINEKDEIFDWDMTREDPGFTHFPINCDDRFINLLWPTKTS